MRPKTPNADDKVELQMTPMIDVVFQLMAFFIMTFRIAAAEGDLNVAMPSVPNPRVSIAPDQPVRVTLVADEHGDLAGVHFNRTPLAGIGDLRGKLVSLVGADSQLRQTQEVEIEADYRLKYRYTLDAVSQISAFVDPSTGRPVSLIEKIKFTRPRAKG
jgi:biopolymer transport protein ExbD